MHNMLYDYKMIKLYFIFYRFGDIGKAEKLQNYYKDYYYFYIIII